MLQKSGEQRVGRAKRLALHLLAVTALGLTAAVTLSATARAQAVDAEQACTPDVFRLCNAYIPDRGRITACLRANRRALSAPCAGVFSPKKATRVAKAKRGKARKSGKKRR